LNKLVEILGELFLDGRSHLPISTKKRYIVTLLNCYIAKEKKDRGKRRQKNRTYKTDKKTRLELAILK